MRGGGVSNHKIPGLIDCNLNPEDSPSVSADEESLVLFAETDQNAMQNPGRGESEFLEFRKMNHLTPFTKKEIASDLSEALGGKESQRRAELLLRTHVFRGYAATRYRHLMAQVDVFPFWQYKTHGDGNVRPSHRELNGKIFPAGHDIWQRIFPPHDWGCRCLVVPLTQGAVSRMKDEGGSMKAQANDGTLLPTQLATPEIYTPRESDLIARSQKLPNGTSLNPSSTWAAAPWSVPGNIRHDWRLIRERYSDQPEVLAAFEQWAAKQEISKGVTVSAWIGEGSTVFQQPLYRAKGVTVEISDEEAAELRRIMNDQGPLNLGGKMPPLQEVMKGHEKVTAFETEVVGDTHENGATWALDGTLKERLRSPDEDNVKMSTRYLHGSVFSHNHPKDGPHSLPDLESLWDTMPAEVRVITKSHLHRVQPGRLSRPQLTWEDIPGSARILSAADAMADTLGGPEHFREANVARVILDWLARNDYILYERIPQ